MNLDLVITLEDIDMELGADEVIKDIKESHKNLNEDELIQLIEKWLELDTEHKATEAQVRIYQDFKVEQLWNNEILVFSGSEFVDEFEYKYKDLLLSILAIFMLMDKLKRPSVIMDAAFSLLKIDREIAERFKGDIADYVYYRYIK